MSTMSRYKGGCSLCTYAPLSETLYNVEFCKHGDSSIPYAAIETHLHPVSLPSAPTTSFMGCSVNGAVCSAGDSVASTVLAVCNSVKNIGYIVHMVRENAFNCLELAKTTSLCMGGKECTVVSIPMESGESSLFTVFSSSSEHGSAMEEGSVMKVLLQMGRISEGIVWYWHKDLLGYSYILNSDEKSMWIAKVDGDISMHQPGGSKMVAPSMRRKVTRVMPFFYCDADKPALLVMGAGGSIDMCKADLEVEVAALSRNIIDRAYRSTVSTGRCFCCQYIDTIHHSFHFGVSLADEGTSTLKLTKQFRQSVKK